MSQDDQRLSVRSRRALNSLQYSPNGRDVVGLSPRKLRLTNKLDLASKHDLKSSNSSPLTKNTPKSISLPDISSRVKTIRSSTSIIFGSAAITKTSTPHQNKTLKSSESPVKSAAQANKTRKNISVILEEKENPNFVLGDAESKSKAINRGKNKNSGIQCNLIDELMLTGDSLDETPYWKILAHKRLAALVEAQEETNHVNREIRELHEKNESLRKKIANFKKIIKEFDEMKSELLEAIDNDDSGYEQSQNLTQTD